MTALARIFDEFDVAAKRNVVQELDRPSRIAHYFEALNHRLALSPDERMPIIVRKLGKYAEKVDWHPRGPLPFHAAVDRRADQMILDGLKTMRDAEVATVEARLAQAMPAIAHLPDLEGL